MTEMKCEACRKAPAKRDDILCLDCTRAYSILMELLSENPDLASEDLSRIKEIYEWYVKRTETAPISR